MNQIHMLYISITNQFENKIVEVDLKAYCFFRGDKIINQFIICLIDIQEKYKVNKTYHDQGSNSKFLASFKIPIFSIIEKVLMDI